VSGSDVLEVSRTGVADDLDGGLGNDVAEGAPDRGGVGVLVNGVDDRSVSTCCVSALLWSLLEVSM
jgi:hypothetical protein